MLLLHQTDLYTDGYEQKKVLTVDILKNRLFNWLKLRIINNLYATVEKGKFKGCIGLGGLILARIPERFLG